MKQTEIEQMRNYIAATPSTWKEDLRYTIDMRKVNVILALFRIDPYEALLLTFEYGRAKGRRAVMARERRERTA